MDVIISRKRIAGMLPFYEYRALVPVTALPEVRRTCAMTVVAPVADGVRCVRIAQLIAPDRYFLLRREADKPALAARIALAAKRVETLIIRTIFPEMTADLVPILFRVDQEPGTAALWTTIDDISGAFDRLEAELPSLTADDLGLRQECVRKAA